MIKKNIKSEPLFDTLVLAADDIILWTLIGVVVAWRLQPEPVKGYEPVTDIKANIEKCFGGPPI